MSEPLTDHADAINQTARRLNEVRTELAAQLSAFCPGPHRLVQHRDTRQPWCEACRYTADGLRVEAPEASE